VELPSFFWFASVFDSVSSVNRADGIGEIEGKAAKARGERVGKRASFKSLVLSALSKFVSIRVNSWFNVGEATYLRESFQVKSSYFFTRIHIAWATMQSH
jgi:hypothetical protein